MTRAWWLVVVALAACEGGPSVQDVPASECASGKKWTGGDAESPLMRPGHDCDGCHRREGEGPRFAAAGTVYAEPDEPNDCLGVEGVDVEITDASGMVWLLETNEAGNFWLSASAGPIEAPYTVRVLDGDLERVKATEQTVTQCPTCHTQTGDNGAPGRVLAPTTPQ